MRKQVLCITIPICICILIAGAWLAIRMQVQYGYRPSDGKRLEPVPHEQEAIALMLELRSEGLGLVKIGEELERRGHVSRTGTRLSPKVISSVIQRAAASPAPHYAV